MPLLSPPNSQTPNEQNLIDQEKRGHKNEKPERTTSVSADDISRRQSEWREMRAVLTAGGISRAAAKEDALYTNCYLHPPGSLFRYIGFV